MRILLTGGEGFIGNALKKSLLKKATQVSSIEQKYCEYKGYETTLFKAVEDCDIIYHVGAISDTMEKDVNKMMYYNVEFSKVLFDLASILNKKVVYSSSAACYGTDGVPSNLYGWSKYIAEIYGVSTVKDFIALRYFNVYGKGESHKGKMASVAYQAWKTGEFKLFPGDIKRDFVYIDDIVDANIYAATLERGLFDVGSGNAETFESLVEGIGIDYEYHTPDKIPGWYQYFTQADKEKFMPGWQPKNNVKLGTKKYKDYLLNS